jgi:hypothetical protein
MLQLDDVLARLEKEMKRIGAEVTVLRRSAGASNARPSLGGLCIEHVPGLLQDWLQGKKC